MYHLRVALGLAGCLGLLGSTVGFAGPQYSIGDPALERVLRQSGWEVRRGDAEGLFLYPPQAAGGTSAASAQQSSPPGSGPGSPAGEAAAGARPDWERLARLGWRVERGADGSTLLYPPVPTANPGRTADSTPVEAEKSLEALLQERGWRVDRDAQGGLLLYPSAPAGTGAAVTPVVGALTAPVRDAAVALPVDRWAEARTIAEAWLAEHGAPGWQVGKIRQIHRVYMVSIVDAARPPTVVHQIAITSGNGLVVVLN